MKPRRTLQQMATEASGQQPRQIAGKPADVCPVCGAGMFVDGVNRTMHDIVRYVECRNPKCRKRFMSRQPPARLIREIGDDSVGGKPALTLVSEAG